MIKFKKGEGLQLTSERDLPFLLLLIAGVIEFVFITMESLFCYIGYYLVEDYIIVPCLLFVGIAMTRKLTPFAKKRMLLAVAAVAWFVIVQIIHKLSGMGTHPISTVLFVYLMAFPFASVTEDRESRGLNLISWIFIAAGMVQVLYAALLVLDCVPAMMKEFVYWDGARLHVFWHPNITACFLMIGIGFACSLIFRTEKETMKFVLAGIILLQFVAMALTNCRTTLLMTSAFFGSIGFFLIFKGEWKRFVIGLAVAVAVMVACFLTTGKVYAWHNERLVAQITEQLQKKADITEKEADKTASEVIEQEQTDVKAAENYTVNEDTGEIKIISQNGQGTLSNDMRHLNGRTRIWKGALSAVRDNRTLALWGTEYVGVVISPYNSFDVVHAHNSWMEALLRLGIPGLLMALLFTGIAVRSAWVLIWSQYISIGKKLVAVLTMCVMVAGFLEPYLFITNVYYHVIDFIFFFCTGYLDYWRRQLTETK